MVKYIWIKNKKYYLYDTYNTWEQARKEALRFRKKNKCRYFITKQEEGWLFPSDRYFLWLNKVMKLW